jgi:hypothetical protein
MLGGGVTCQATDFADAYANNKQRRASRQGESPSRGANGMPRATVWWRAAVDYFAV